MLRNIGFGLALLLLCGSAAALATGTYVEGRDAYRAGEYTMAYRILLPLARKDDVRAMYLVGLMYDGGRSVPQDDATAAGWFKASAARGYASSQYVLGRMTIEGRGVPKSRDKGVALLRAAARQGHKEAAVLVGQLDAAAASRSARREPAASGDAGAPAQIAAAPVTTVSAAAKPVTAPITAPVTTPVTAAFARFDRPLAQAALAALSGVLQRLALRDDAQMRAALPGLAGDFARQYWHVESIGEADLAAAYGRLVRDHADLAAALARELSAAPAAESQAVGGLLSRLGNPALARGAGPATRAGCPATVKAAQGGYPFAWFQAAQCVAAEDAAQASDWLLMAASAGHAGAQESAGRACVEGATKEWACAKAWLGRAADAGRSSALPVLAWTLANQPQASEADVRAAVQWYQSAASSGDAVSMNNLAALLERGPATVRDLVQARDWYSRAARNGFGPAQLNLGRMLAQGEGGAANRDEALEWLRRAEASGVAEARAMREQIAR